MIPGHVTVEGGPHEGRALPVDDVTLLMETEDCWDGYLFAFGGDEPPTLVYDPDGVDELERTNGDEGPE